MGRRTQFGLLCILCVFAIAQLVSQQNPSQIDSEHTAWIAGVLNTAQTIKSRNAPLGPDQSVHD
jgi:hypothetical protein